ncbi:uncharacterized protein PFL1_00450 [Pseudozyma flocculosa PF-1]|uniref:DUF7704 domain-containing protein n=1 Tax=Pseudozyma flocculosa TaxID=84751 RepID=A0A5C3ESU5_9BASI|nr:uncharacterized protein PFL1_00450 [Pseudozyma flocculosa PF-1]EPQ32253.1 hypothetical protein PFL1_00450 [Pseudozyma flocculosa PF-1]SPO34795.1 uncharacterized protein PSFLO_00266 [Pseudozyma flocculosa]
MSDPLPFHWYFFFGILEPISVLAGAYYAIGLPERYHYELIPHAFLLPAQVQTLLKNATTLSDNARMALGQLGSCYSLIMLNSLLLFYAFRKHLSSQPAVLEKMVYYLIAVLGIADWSHILLTLYLLPNGPPSPRILLLSSKATWHDKLVLLAQPSSWNSLLFGNIIITFILFCFRALWWFGVARGSPIADQKRAAAAKQKAT